MKTYAKYLALISLIVLSSGCSKFLAEQEIRKKGFDTTQESLLIAISLNRADVVKLFVDSKFNLNPETDQTPIARASAANNYEITKMLLDAGAVPQREGLGEPGYAIDISIAGCNSEIFELLLNHGAKLNVGIPNKKKWAEEQVQHGRYKCLKILKLLEEKDK